MIDAGIATRIVDVNSSLDQSSNDVILANIVRASQEQPLLFVAVSKVNGSQQFSLANGLPTLTFGPNKLPTQEQFIFGNNNVNNQAGGNFDVAPLSTRDFTKGMASAIPLPEMLWFRLQGAPQNLLMHLLLDSIEYTTEDGRRRVWRNDPRDGTYRNFVAAAVLFTDYGFSVETREEPASGGESRGSGRGGDGRDTPKTVTVGRFCFDAASASRMIAEKKWRCKEGWAEARKKESGDVNEPIAVSLPWGAYVVKNVRFNMRSVYGVFNYLGKTLEFGPTYAFNDTGVHPVAQAYESLYKGSAKPAAAEFPNANNLPILVVAAEHGRGCFAYASLNGTGYCVPAESSGHTKRVFAILQQLIALRTSASDLPSTPSVRLTP